MPWKTECEWPTLDGPYRRAMAFLGSYIGRHPLPFLLVPMFVSFAFVYPFVQGISDYRRLAITRAGAIELFTPSQSRSDRDRRLLMQTFPDGGYFRDRTVVTPGLFVVLISARSNSDQSMSPSIFQDFYVNAYRQLRSEIENLTIVTNDNRSISIRSLCQSIVANQSIMAISILGKCQPDAFLSLWTLHRSGLSPSFTYPYMKLELPSFSSAVLESLAIPNNLYIGPLFGGVRTDDHKRVQYAKYVRMIFRLPIDSDNDISIVDQLGMKFSEYLDQYKSDTLMISYWASQKYARDMQLISKRVVRLLPALVFLLLTFALISCCMKDCVLSKPWLALGGLVSAGLGLQVGFAILFVAGVDLIEIAMIVPFLVLSIGLDDTFVMLNVWRSTDPSWPTEKRLAMVFEEAAVSITITSVTDVAAFVIGLSSVFPAVRIFCAFCASALFAVFVYQLTFFGACLTYSGRQEADGRHCITFRKVKKIKEPDQESLLNKIFCATALDEKKPTNPASNDFSGSRRPWPVLFFKNHFANWLHRPAVKLTVAFTYVVYIGSSVFFLAAFLRQGLQVSNLVPYDSSTHDYLTLYERYFSKCSTSAEVLITASEPYQCQKLDSQRLDYGNPDVQRTLVDWALSFEHTDFTYKIDFWLYQYMIDRQHRFDQAFNQSIDEESNSNEILNEGEEKNFILKLEGEFLQQKKYQKYADHLTIDQCHGGSTDNIIDKRFINATRFYVQLANMGFENRSAAMHLLREKADKAPLGFEAHVFDVSFPLAEQYDAVLPGVLYDVAVGVGCMLAVACLFVPNLLICLCIAFTVFSINIGVLGYMAIWGVNLDIISTITILLSIGFSVDYTSHVAYHFYVSGRGVSDKRITVETKVAEALETAGWPIMQSSMSMMVGVVTVLGVRAYISDTFVKTVLLVMLIGVYHALVVLPVLLSVVSNSPRRQNQKQDSVSAVSFGRRRRATKQIYTENRASKIPGTSDKISENRFRGNMTEATAGRQSR